MTYAKASRASSVPRRLRGACLVTAAGLAMTALTTVHAGDATHAWALGTGALVLLYCFANVGYVAALGPERAAASRSLLSNSTGHSVAISRA